MALDWGAIKTEYITTEISLSKLAAKHGVTKGALGAKCSKEKWVDERKRYKNSVITQTINARAGEDANHLSELLGAAEMITGIAVEALTKREHLYTYMVERRERYTVPVDSVSGDIWDETGDGVPVAERQWTEDRVSDAINTKALKDLASIVKDMTGLLRDFYNIPTPAQQDQREIARERLELEKRKADQVEADDDEIGVVFLPPRLEAEQ